VVIVREVYNHQIREKLINTLPMDDAKFLASLKSNNFLAGDLESRVTERSYTRAQSASHFLTETIDRSFEIDNMEHFDALLIVMVDYGNLLKQMVEFILNKIEERVNEVSKFVCKLSSLLPTL